MVESAGVRMPALQEVIMSGSQKPNDLNYCHDKGQWCNFAQNNACVWNREGDRKCCFEVGISELLTEEEYDLRCGEMERDTL